MSKDRVSTDLGPSGATDAAGTAQTRRDFLASAIPGVTLAAAWPVVAASPPPEAAASSPAGGAESQSGGTELSRPEHPLEEVLRRYGSELGDLTRLS